MYISVGAGIGANFGSKTNENVLQYTFSGLLCVLGCRSIIHGLRMIR